MIPFLVVTAILNVALGYALAVYLGKANAPSLCEIFAMAPTSTPAIEATSFVEQFSMLQNDRSPPIDDGSSSVFAIPQTAEQSADDATRSTITAHQADDEPFAHAEVMEQELLAGIEEFRNQLSQLKGQGVAGILLDTMALDAAR
ncbi:MAG: hypothetical protein H0T51_22040 [Pirellulales bacterium]|nr:hypothetical protein [Pirellulales bacterium]